MKITKDSERYKTKKRLFPTVDKKLAEDLESQLEIEKLTLSSWLETRIEEYLKKVKRKSKKNLSNQ